MLNNSNLYEVSSLNSILLSVSYIMCFEKSVVTPKFNKLLKVKEKCFNNIVEKFICTFNKLLKFFFFF